MTSIRFPGPVKLALSFLTAIALTWLAAPLMTTSAAATSDPRFGLVQAIDAPHAADDSGASWELLTMRWDRFQPGSAGPWAAPAGIDNWVSAARTSGREVVGVLIGTPAWATDGKPGIGVPRGLYLPVNDAGNLWASFVRQTVGYYAARGINRWVIWDTPNIPGDVQGSQWEGTTEDYYQLVKVAYLVAKGANPGALIHLGAVSDRDPGWFARFLKVVVNDPTAQANNYYFDVASVQVFGSPDRVYTLTANPSYLMDQAGMSLKPVWLNATNARPAVDPKTYPPDKKFNQYAKVTLEQQAAFIIQAYALGFAAQADRIAVYRLADDLPEDGDQAFGLVRAEGDPRPAFNAYQLVVKEFSGFKLARRVDEDAHPLIEYVRLTFPDKVTHVAWALTANNATLIIPARSEKATLINMNGDRWEVKPEGGIYKLVVGGADCNDPNTVGGCLIGGDPWMLVEEGVQNALTEAAPKSKAELGGKLATPPPTPTPTLTPTETPTSTFTPSPVPPTSTALPPTATTEKQVTPTVEATAASAAQPVQTPTLSETPTLTPTPSPEELAKAIRPRGLQALLPYLLMGLGALVIGGGLWFFLGGRKKTLPPAFEPAPELEALIDVEPPKPKRSHRKTKASAPEEPPQDEDQAQGQD